MRLPWVAVQQGTPYSHMNVILHLLRILKYLSCGKPQKAEKSEARYLPRTQYLILALPWSSVVLGAKTRPVRVPPSTVL
jgi:hypothetical protein